MRVILRFLRFFAVIVTTKAQLVQKSPFLIFFELTWMPETLEDGHIYIYIYIYIAKAKKLFCEATTRATLEKKKAKITLWQLGKCF